jgi:large subunit ribosomal protein L23
MHEILIKPLITEKMTNLSADTGKYGFIVNLKSNKIEIAKAVEKKFNVHVVSVRTIIIRERPKPSSERAGDLPAKLQDLKKQLLP